MTKYVSIIGSLAKGVQCFTIHYIPMQVIIYDYNREYVDSVAVYQK